MKFQAIEKFFDIFFKAGLSKCHLNGAEGICWILAYMVGHLKSYNFA